jgi:DNA-directed RNA polymerase I subunit RPA2
MDFIAKPHLDSFNSIFTEEHLDKIASACHTQVEGKSIFLKDIRVGKPGSTIPLYPSDCREQGISYASPWEATLMVNGFNFKVSLGLLPIMVNSKKCNLYGKPKLKHKEDELEFGGYFILNGIERLIRLLIAPLRNYPTAIIRNSFTNRGHTYTRFGVQIRSVRSDQTAQTVTLHYLNDGNVTLRFSFRKNEYMVPLILIMKALEGATDQDIYNRITMQASDTLLSDRVQMLLQYFKRYNLHSKNQCLSYLGSKFAAMLGLNDETDSELIGQTLLDRIILVHLESNTEKFELLM